MVQDSAGQEFNDDLTLQIRGVDAVPHHQADPNADPSHGTIALTLDTSRGPLRALLDQADGSTGAALFFSGARAGPHEVLGPGDNVYETLAHALPAQGITTLRLFYRQAGQFDESVLDVLAGCSFLTGVGVQRIAVVGHSFGGAVAIKAGQLAPAVKAVAALSSQTHGTRQVNLMRKPLLLIHGTRDNVLHMAASEDIYARAREPKQLVLVDGAGHRLQEGAQQLFDELEPFLLAHLGPTASP